MKKVSLIFLFSITFLSMFFMMGKDISAQGCTSDIRIGVRYNNRRVTDYGRSYGWKTGLVSQFKYLNRCGQQDYADPKVISYDVAKGGRSVVRDDGIRGYVGRYYKVQYPNAPTYTMFRKHSGDYRGHVTKSIRQVWR